MRIDIFGDTLCASVTAAVLAQAGHRVRWYLPDGRIWRELEQGRVAYREPGLSELTREQIDEGRLSCDLLGEEVGELAPVVFLSLQPGSLDLAQWITDAAGSQSGCRLLVNQSVFPVGTTDLLQSRVNDLGGDVRVISLPENLQEGVALESFARSHHILLGCDDPQAERLIREILRPYNRRQDVIQVMRPIEAEFTKLAISGMLATRLSFMNDMALLAENLSVDIDRVRQGMGADPRIGQAYLYPGCGFGGPGFSRDVMTLTDALRHKTANAGLLEEVMEINERQKEVLFRRFWQYFDGEVAGRRVTLWGAAFKPGSDRVDNGPALRLIEALWAQGVRVAVHDPLALAELARWAEGRGELELFDDPYDALSGSDALMLVTEWRQYWSPEWERLLRELRTPLILDGRNIYDPAFVRESGLRYFGVGRA